MAEIPASLRRAGIASLSDNLAEGESLDLAKDFARIFRNELEARLFGWQQPTASGPRVRRLAKEPTP